MNGKKQDLNALAEKYESANNSDCPLDNSIRPKNRKSIKLGLHPNPVSKVLVIETFLGDDAEGTVSVFDMQGMRLMTFQVKESGAHRIVIDKKFRQGMYVVKLTSGLQNVTKKFVVVKSRRR